MYTIFIRFSFFFAQSSCPFLWFSEWQRKMKHWSSVLAANGYVKYAYFMHFGYVTSTRYIAQPYTVIRLHFYNCIRPQNFFFLVFWLVFNLVSFFDAFRFFFRFYSLFLDSIHSVPIRWVHNFLFNFFNWWVQCNARISAIFNRHRVKNDTRNLYSDVIWMLFFSGHHR